MEFEDLCDWMEGCQTEPSVELRFRVSSDKELDIVDLVHIAREY